MQPEEMDLTSAGGFQWTLRCGSTAEDYEIPEKYNSSVKMPLYQELLDKHNVHNRCRKYRDDPISVTIPGEVHKHLLAAGILQHDISYRNEHQEQAWVAF